MIIIIHLSDCHCDMGHGICSSRLEEVEKEIKG